MTKKHQTLLILIMAVSCGLGVSLNKAEGKKDVLKTQHHHFEKRGKVHRDLSLKPHIHGKSSLEKTEGELKSLQKDEKSLAKNEAFGGGLTHNTMFNEHRLEPNLTKSQLFGASGHSLIEKEGLGGNMESSLNAEIGNSGQMKRGNMSGSSTHKSSNPLFEPMVGNTPIIVIQ